MAGLVSLAVPAFAGGVEERFAAEAVLIEAPGGLPPHPAPATRAGYHYQTVRARVGSALRELIELDEVGDDLRALRIRVAKSYLTEADQYLAEQVPAAAPRFGKVRKAAHAQDTARLRAAVAVAWGRVNAVPGAAAIQPYGDIDARAYERHVRRAAIKLLLTRPSRRPR